MDYPIDIANLDQGLDRDLLIKLKKRFLAISEERLARTRLGLSDRQQVVLDALPALYHYNHPALPGYVSNQTPAGLSNYKLQNRTKLAFKRLSRSFNFNDTSHREADVHAVFIMGSVGSIAHGSRSDLDVWVCHRPGLDSAALRLLSLKGERISRWAQTLGVEVHCFTMDAEAFKSGRMENLDDESSGSTQHFLLLDEFYRTAIWLGGRIPLWWFVPPEREQDYNHCADLLVRKQFIRPNEVLDFGSAAHIPAGEFVGAGIWHLYKGIDSPYKSVLKLLLLEAYADNYPQIDTLSLDFKRRVYHGEVNLDRLDAYVGLYQRLENYLTERKELKRLELVRRAFYFKVHCPLTRSPSALGWQWRLMKSLVIRWDWNDRHIAHMDNRKNWKAAQVKLEKHNLVHELITSYRFISNFANQVGAKNSIDQQELETLGHKLHAAFDRKAGKIECINPDISADLSEGLLMIRYRPQRPTAERWSVYALPNRQSMTNRNLLLKQASHLNELLCWCLVNEIYKEGTEILVEGSRVKTANIKHYLSSLAGCFNFPLEKAKHSDFLAGAKLDKAMVFINLMEEEEPSARGTASNSDPFCYGDDKIDLVGSVDLIYSNSWNEIVCQSFTEQPLLQFTQRYLQLCYSQGNAPLPRVYIFCARSQHSAIINARLQEFFSELNPALQTVLSQPQRLGLNFIFQTDQRYHLLRGDGRKSSLDSYSSADYLLDAVQRPNYNPGHWLIDNRTLPDTPLRLIYSKAKEPGIKVFFYLMGEHRARLYFMDDLQNLTISQLPFGRLDNLLQAQHLFIRRIISRELYTRHNSDQSFGVYPVTFYRLRRVGTRWSQCEPMHVAAQVSSNNHFEVKAIAEPSQLAGALSYRLIFDQMELEGDVEQQLSDTAKFIMARRDSKESYPCYLSDLDLSLCRNDLSEGGDLLLGHFLRIKNDIEQRINAYQRKLP
ncbi:class I adenylate cyclase [Halioxenophilus sp. WMMB6]|uniref:class I adenylate cyclase n=1 Tax=Halioxenophilus sp. WMMB6 TaxID=3073815 RepID=UPI00295E852F|nr:class I adenylate cyclase [Halioxenophilus sp. WMMB6]